MWQCDICWILSALWVCNVIMNLWVHKITVTMNGIRIMHGYLLLWSIWKGLCLPCPLHASKVHLSSQEVTTCSRYLQYFVLSLCQVWRVPQVVTLFRFIIPNSPPETFSHPHVSVLMTASSFVSTPWRQTEILQLENTFIFRATNFDVWRSFNQDYQLF